MSQIEQDLKSYEEFCDPDVLVSVIGDGCDLLHRFVDHTKALQSANAELVEALRLARGRIIIANFKAREGSATESRNLETIEAINAAIAKNGEAA